MKHARCIRIFKSFDEAKRAQNLLRENGITSRIKEDKFGKLTLADLSMESRFRFYIQMEDIPKAGAILAKLLKRQIR
jgi:hypothetical protein